MAQVRDGGDSLEGFPGSRLAASGQAETPTPQMENNRHRQKNSS